MLVSVRRQVDPKTFADDQRAGRLPAPGPVCRLRAVGAAGRKGESPSLSFPCLAFRFLCSLTGRGECRLIAGLHLVNRCHVCVRCETPDQLASWLVSLPAAQAAAGSAITVFGHTAMRRDAISSSLRVLQALEQAGCFAIVLECVPAAVAAAVTAEIGIPTIGIGAGAGCSGQVAPLDYRRSVRCSAVSAARLAIHPQYQIQT
jgi:Ketopantoate hydroxymethyltransferase